MKPMRIDFADQPSLWRWNWRMPGVRLMVVLLVLAALLGGLALQRGLRLRAELAQVQEAHARLLAMQQQSVAAERDRVRMGAGDETLLRQASLQRMLPWETIFRAFEQAPAARLLAFEPDVARGVVKVQANLADVAAVQDYLRALEANPVFLRVSLLRHEAPLEGGGVNFQYEAVLAAAYRLPETETRGAP